MDLVKCNRCFGAKKYAPMGGILVICKPCNGTGLMDKAEFVPIMHGNIKEKNPAKANIDPIESPTLPAITSNEVEPTLGQRLIDSLESSLETGLIELKGTPKPITAAEILDTPIKKKPGRKPGYKKPDNAVNLI